MELYCEKDANIKYSTVQNWYAGDVNGKGGIYNFVTKRGLCSGPNSKISWTQVCSVRSYSGLKPKGMCPQFVLIVSDGLGNGVLDVLPACS